MFCRLMTSDPDVLGYLHFEVLSEREKQALYVNESRKWIVYSLYINESRKMLQMNLFAG